MDELMRSFHSVSDSNPIRLNNNTLIDLPDNIKTPTYDRSKLEAGIVHIGVGNFHRAHLSWYIHQLLERGLDQNWGIIGASVRPQDTEMREKLLAQDFLSTLIELDPEGNNHAEIVGSMIDYVPINSDNNALIQIMADPKIKIISMTITEGGYYQDSVSKQLDASHPDIRHDIQNPDKPKTVFGAMVAALNIRHRNGYGPFTGLCCDNLQGNGAVLANSVLSLARLRDAKLAEWIEENCSFPNSMVDCIVPATGTSEKELALSLGIDDEIPVTHENFRQWVIEDNFCAGRPKLELVGALFSNRVHQHETQKIRVLNGGHQILANSAEILGISKIHEAITNPIIAPFFEKVVEEEILPHIEELPDLSKSKYLDLIKNRFANPSVLDTVRRVAFDGSSRHPGFIIPSIIDGLNYKKSINGLALVEAAWARMCEGTREDGTKISPNDPSWSVLNKAAKEAKHKPEKWLELNNIYGGISENKIFASAFEKWLTRIYQHGIEQTINMYLSE
ncbi:MAG: mannitol dehydrogenase family protein [Alphaproteobacteria bacterium]|jgi:mannitol 2-dehydrogenase|nr:mannitol dehydrogenase family protein [Alphaproteobacteria bacterium]